MPSEASYTFDLNGNLASRTEGGKTWIFQHNAFDQLVLVTDPDQTNITFTYGLNGKRLSKQIEEKGKEPKVLRYFYLGQTEIGCLDEKGALVELRIPSNPNNPEAAPFITFEIKKDLYVPIYDLQGNLACLVDPEHRKVVEGYRYSAFGEEEITDEQGNPISDSSVGNPWRYCGKRVDRETGLLYFGYRYYDPEVGRWISPDPAGKVDGPNLYAFCHNNPLTYVDYFGLAAEENKALVDEKYFYGEYEPHCYCERHRDCKRGGDLARVSGSFGKDVANLFFNSRIQGAIQVFGGIAEISVGGGLTYVSGGIAGAAGWVAMTHGLDHFITGMRIVIDGEYGETATSQVLQACGVSRDFAEGIDAGLSFGPSKKASGIVSWFGKSEEVALQYTKSNLRLGQQVHQSYKVAIADLRLLRKEFKLPSGRRIDFLDIKNGKVYELKPNNPRAIREGMKQLNSYIEELKTMDRFKGKNWEGILEVY